VNNLGILNRGFFELIKDSSPLINSLCKERLILTIGFAFLGLIGGGI
jgi:hypothetical protein